MSGAVARAQGEDEIKEWSIMLQHVDGLTPIFLEHGYTKSDCLFAWLIREGIKNADDEEVDEDE